MAIQKTVKATGDFIRYEIADKITSVSKTLQKNNLKAVTNEHDKEISKKVIHLQKKDRKLLMIQD